VKVLYLANIPSPYRVDFFNELGQQIDLTVIFERETASDRDENWMKKKKQTLIPYILNQPILLLMVL